MASAAKELRMKQVVILRGVPGAGKSTLVAREFPGCTVVSADHHFMVGGEYRFNPAELPAAHRACWLAFLAAMQSGAETIVVDNTSTSVAEVSPYVLPAEAHGYSVKIITLLCPPSVAAERNVHGVPPVAVGAMDARLRDSIAALPPWWDHEVRMA